MNPVRSALENLISDAVAVAPASIEFLILYVDSVDKDKRICLCHDFAGRSYRNITLTAIRGSSFFFPALGSVVFVLYSRPRSLGFVLGYSLLESAELVIGDASAVMNADTLTLTVGNMSAKFEKDVITFNGGSLNGLPKIDDLTNRLNIIEKDINSLKSMFSGWSPVPRDGGAALKGAVTSWASSTLTETKRADYENTEIKQ